MYSKTYHPSSNITKSVPVPTPFSLPLGDSKLEAKSNCVVLQTCSEWCHEFRSIIPVRSTRELQIFHLIASLDTARHLAILASFNSAPHAIFEDLLKCLRTGAYRLDTGSLCTSAFQITVGVLPRSVPESSSQLCQRHHEFAHRPSFWGIPRPSWRHRLG